MWEAVCGLQAAMFTSCLALWRLARGASPDNAAIFSWAHPWAVAAAGTVAAFPGDVAPCLLFGKTAATVSPRASTAPWSGLVALGCCRADGGFSRFSA